ncbi:hypothetical protein [Anoxybacillus ayderensis]|jgi:hypothetical protein|uniref:hypothetical protein n=1 Tax=Anoxybacillus ayderensis TaxID=265546 RepID=UPI002E1B4BA6|nr:hypothetical protein [Anoxybacillus ayderensis]
MNKFESIEKVLEIAQIILETSKEKEWEDKDFIMAINLLHSQLEKVYQYHF